MLHEEQERRRNRYGVMVFVTLCMEGPIGEGIVTLGLSRPSVFVILPSRSGSLHEEFITQA